MAKKRKHKFIAKLKEKLEMYDMIIANFIAGNSVIEPDEYLDKSRIDIGFSNISSATAIMKYFIVKSFPDWLNPNFKAEIRSRCTMPGVKVDFYTYVEPHTINWDSAEMQSRLKIYKEYAEENASNGSAFEYRKRRDAILARDRIVNSTKYLNEAELDYKRTLSKAYIVIALTSLRDEESLINMERAIRTLKRYCTAEGIKITDIKVNMIDWLQSLSIFSLKKEKEVLKKISKRIVTDDILASLNSYKQGKVGDRGIPLGIDVNSKVVALYQFKGDPNKAENWLISAKTGAGKSLFVKMLISWLLGSGYIVTVMDYEGDEYTNYAAYVRQANTEDVKVISMGKGSMVYFDPMEIPMLTGDSEIDSELKETAITYTLGLFRIIVAGLDSDLTIWEDSVLSTAIKRVYEQYGVTDDPSTWHRSKGLTVHMVYDEIVNIVERREFVDETIENAKHRAAVRILEACKTYFEEGEAKSYVFKQPMSINELYKAKFISFSFGMRGATNSQQDNILLALKQLCVANISTQISNYCKYIRKTFNVKIWEEYQRWGEARGSAEIIGNAMTGGRKRGDINFIITNDLAAMLDDSNPINAKLRQNITSYAIGAIKDKDVRRKFCEKFNLQEVQGELDLIAKANSDDINKDGKRNRGGKYSHAFCIIMDNGKKAVVKQMVPRALLESSLFKTGVDIERRDM